MHEMLIFTHTTIIYLRYERINFSHEFEISRQLRNAERHKALTN